MQSLRERLIKEGSIVPNQENAFISEKSISELAGSIKDKIEKFFSFLSGSRKKFSALEKYIQEFTDRFSGIDLVSKSDCSYFSLLGFLNLHRILDVLVKNQDRRVGSFIFVRAGFFFAFKECMKNTP